MTSVNEVSYNRGVIVSSLTEEQYKNYILYIVNRILNEKLYKIVEKRENGQIKFSIQLKYIEWYLELDDEVRYNVEINLQHHITQQIEILCKTMNYEKRYGLINEDFQESNKRQKL